MAESNNFIHNIIEKDLDLAERKLNQAKQLWQSNMLK